MLYLLSIYLPRFQELAWRNSPRCCTELWHIGPAFDGDLRRHPGRCYAHSRSRRRYEAGIEVLLERWLAGEPPKALHAFKAQVRRTRAAARADPRAEPADAPADSRAGHRCQRRRQPRCGRGGGADNPAASGAADSAASSDRARASGGRPTAKGRPSGLHLKTLSRIRRLLSVAPPWRRARTRTFFSLKPVRVCTRRKSLSGDLAWQRSGPSRTFSSC